MGSYQWTIAERMTNKEYTNMFCLRSTYNEIGVLDLENAYHDIKIHLYVDDNNTDDIPM